MAVLSFSIRPAAIVLPPLASRPSPHRVGIQQTKTAISHSPGLCSRLPQPVLSLPRQRARTRVVLGSTCDRGRGRKLASAGLPGVALQRGGVRRNKRHPEGEERRGEERGGVSG